MLAFVSQVSTLVIGNECGTDAACPGCKDHKELKKREAKTFEKKDLLKTPFIKNEVGDKKPSFKKEETDTIRCTFLFQRCMLGEKYTWFEVTATMMTKKLVAIVLMQKRLFYD